MDLKERVERNFDRASRSYDGVGDVQKRCAYQLVSMIREHCAHARVRSILDVGTGTGNVPTLLREYFPEARYTLNDLSSRMIASVQRKFAHRGDCSFWHGDIECLPVRFHDLITSNLCFQWVRDLQGLLVKLYNKSRFLAFSCLLRGTFRSWNARLLSYGLRGFVRRYPSLHRLTRLLDRMRPRHRQISVSDFLLSFDSPIEAMHYLKRLGANVACDRQIDAPSLLRFVRLDKNPSDLEYRVAHVILEGDE